LPINRRPIVTCMRFRGSMFTESLPSNGSICYTIFWSQSYEQNFSGNVELIIDL
jgi:hypothetical protein